MFLKSSRSFRGVSCTVASSTIHHRWIFAKIQQQLQLPMRIAAYFSVKQIAIFPALGLQDAETKRRRSNLLEAFDHNDYVS